MSQQLGVHECRLGKLAEMLFNDAEDASHMQ